VNAGEGHDLIPAADGPSLTVALFAAAAGSRRHHHDLGYCTHGVSALTTMVGSAAARRRSAVAAAVRQVLAPGRTRSTRAGVSG
jgi:hypothetical protein